MKKIVEVSNSGLESLLGKKVVIYACRFIYTGKLTGVNDNCIEIEGAQIVYDTGEHTNSKKSWTNVENMWNDTWYISTTSIESFGLAPF
jgi:hypothetical protein